MVQPTPQRQTSPPQAQAYGSPYAYASPTSPPNANAGQHQPERSYTLGGGGAYDAYSDPYYAPSHTQQTSSSMPMPGMMPGATAITTDMPSPGRSPVLAGYAPRVQSPPQGHSAYYDQHEEAHYDDSPPVYDAGPSGPAVPVPEWGSKGR